MNDFVGADPVDLDDPNCEEYIEERILELQSRKGALSNAVLEGALDGQGLSKDDLLGLFLSGG
jgi:SNF2 family DNA or RNA helicase